MERPAVFADIKVIDFSTTVVGPSATRVLADYGATVIKVESMTHPEVLRTSPPFPGGKRGLNRSGYFNNYNAGKLSLSLNLNHPSALELVKRLVKWADVLVESFSTGIMERWGLSYEELKKVKPDLIMVSTNMLGQYGPCCRFRGYGMHGAAIAGWGTTLGYRDGQAVLTFGAYTDYIATRYVAIGIMAALEYRRRTGRGQHIDSSQVECSIDFLAPLVPDYSANKRLPHFQGNRDPHAAPHGAYRCQGKDGWCVISVSTDDEWRAFCRVLDTPHWTSDPKFSSLLDRKRNEDELDRLIEDWTVNYPPEEITMMMQKEGVPAAVVQSSKDLAEDPQLKHRGHFKPLEHSEIGYHRYENFGFRLSRTPGGPQAAAPCLGEHTEYVCTEILGLSDEEFVQLMVDGVLE